MELTFSSIDEVKEFVKSLKTSRTGKNDAADDTPAPMQPPNGATAGGFGNTAFNPNPAGAFGGAPQGAGAGQQGGAFTAAAANPAGPSPEVFSLVKQIEDRTKSLIQQGQPVEGMTNWFRGECSKLGVDAGQYTLDQIMQSALPRMSPDALKVVAKLTGIPGY